MPSWKKACTAALILTFALVAHASMADDSISDTDRAFRDQEAQTLLTEPTVSSETTAPDAQASIAEDPATEEQADLNTPITWVSSSDSVVAPVGVENPATARHERIFNADEEFMRFAAWNSKEFLTNRLQVLYECSYGLIKAGERFETMVYDKLVPSSTERYSQGAYTTLVTQGELYVNTGQDASIWTSKADERICIALYRSGPGRHMQWFVFVMNPGGMRLQAQGITEYLMLGVRSSTFDSSKNEVHYTVSLDLERMSFQGAVTTKTEYTEPLLIPF